MKSLKWYLYFLYWFSCQFAKYLPLHYLLLSICFSVFSSESFRYWSTCKSIVHNFISVVVTTFYGHSKWEGQIIVYPIPTLDWAVEEQVWRTNLFEFCSTCKRFKHEPHLLHPAAHLVKTRDAGWISKLPGLVKLSRETVELPALSLSFSVQPSIQCVHLSTL